MYILKPFTTKTVATGGLPIVDCYIGIVKIGTITTNFMKRPDGNFQYVFRSAITLDGDGAHIYANNMDALQEMALNKFRELICNLLD